MSLVSALAFASAALADCAQRDDVVLDCAVGNKTLVLCIVGDTVVYEFGPKGAPELRLIESAATVAHQPWNGVGRSIWESTTLVNNAYAYEVHISLDRMAEGTPLAGGVIVTKDGAEIASLACTNTDPDIGLWAVADAKQRLGQCWDFDQLEWANCEE